MFSRTIDILERTGHSVTVYERDNAEITGVVSAIQAAFSGVYSISAKQQVGHVLDAVRPEIVHAHNLFPLLSPSILAACRERGIPVVMRLADFSMICPAAHHFHNGRVCERCAGGHEYHCVLHSCRGNALRSSAYAARTASVRMQGFLRHLVNRFIAPSHFVRTKYAAAGLPAGKIEVAPNPVPLPAVPARPAAGAYVAYVGRLSREKGFDVLLRAAAICQLPVKIAGEPSPGFVLPELPANVQLLGRLTSGELASFYRSARLVAVPSLGLESFGLACAEAMAHGVPVIASRIGALPEVIGSDGAGVLIPPGDAQALAQTATKLWSDPEALMRIGLAAYKTAANRFNAFTYYANLMRIYEFAIADQGRQRCN
jgi:glycosyltransferase involved in cell wall biosynthesis